MFQHFENIIYHSSLYIMVIFTRQIMHVLETLWTPVLSDNRWE